MVRIAMLTLMNRQVTPVTEHNRITIFSLRIITHCTSRVFGRHSKIRLWYIFGLVAQISHPNG